ncbi:MAG TPA: hypothetical protein VG488_09775 [Candidatus Angelobacter sp.]|jgi:hypothetical protein|nr:hypothetical protein [Candidatus Angelobacter sp.]
MELLDQYLKTIKTFLPKEQQDDIIRELSENLRSQMEDHEAELGRPLTQAEQEAILQQHGNPMVVAGRYQRQNRNLAFGRQLIGPVLFPLYIKILSLNLGLTAAAIFVIGFAMGQGLELGAFLIHAVIQFAIVTLVFAAAERYLLRSKDYWNPRDFGLPTKGKQSPFLWLESFSRVVTSVDPSKVARSESVALIIFNLILALWWIAIPSYLVRTMLGAAGAFLKLGPGCTVLYLPILFLAIAGMVQPIVNLFRPQWTWLPAAWRTISTAIFVAVLCFSLKTGSWVVLTDSSDKLVQHQQAIETVNHACRLGLAIGISICIVIFLLELRLLQRRRSHSLPATRTNGMELS